MILSQGRETITLAEEFEMVRVYLQIQKKSGLKNASILPFIWLMKQPNIRSVNW